jgi:uncharacterized membrane protein (UPF0127 family)
MKEAKIKIKDKQYTVKIALSEEDQKKGLQGIKELPKDEGMLFVVDEPIGIWMKDTLIPLDIVFIDSDSKVIKVVEGTPNSEKIIEEDSATSILEVNAKSGIQKGDEVEFSPETATKLDNMFVLNADGTPQMELEGGERIFSRRSTKIIIKKVKKAAATEKDLDYKNVARYVFQELSRQDNRDDEYVEKK